MTIDVFADAEKPQGSIELARAKAEEMIRLEEEVRLREERLSEAKAKLRQVQENDLPDLMMELGLRNFTLATGEKIQIKEFVNASLSKERKAEAMSWLKENGAADLIKSEVTVAFGKGHEEEARALAEQIKGVVETSVHSMTLSAWVKEQFEKGMSIPEELISVYAGRKATFKKG